jgi:hypothetical protein
VPEAPIDPLLLGQRVAAILETGLRTATYKLATLTALIDQCIEHLPDTRDAPLTVPIPELAHRVLEIYWRQVRLFDGHELRQSTQPRARILTAASMLRAGAGSGHGGGSALDIAMVRAPEMYRVAVDEVTLCLAQQPLHRLQHLPGEAGSDPFLYDDAFLHDHISRATLRAHGDAIELKPGIAYGLTRLAGLLKPALEIMWVDDVRRMNKFLDAEVPDVAGHLFGRERISLAAVREPFKDVFIARCFYCHADLRSDNPIDHVLPWSLVGIDGLANLVLDLPAVQRRQTPGVAVAGDCRPGTRARSRCAGADRHRDCLAHSVRTGDRCCPWALPRTGARCADVVGAPADEPA